MPACTVTSSAVVGSSMTSSSGRPARAKAIETRCAIPPDSSCGYAAGDPFRIDQLHLLEEFETPALSRLPPVRRSLMRNVSRRSWTHPEVGVEGDHRLLSHVGDAPAPVGRELLLA